MIKKICSALCILIFSFILFAEKSVDQKINELEKRLELVKGKEKVDIINEFVKKNHSSFPTKSLEYTEKTLELAREIKYKKGEAIALYFKGRCYLFLGDCSSALKFSEESLNINREIKDKYNVALTLNFIGVIYSHSTKHEKSLEYCLKSLRIFKELKDKQGITGASVNIGNVYRSIKQYEKSLEYFIKSLKGFEEMGNKRGIAGTLANIGIVYGLLKNYEKSLEYCQKSLGKFEEMNDKEGVAGTLCKIGDAYLQLAQYEKSLKYFQNSLEKFKEIEYKKGIVETFTKIGLAHALLKNFKKSKEYYRKSLQLAQKIHAKGLIMENYELSSELFAKIGDFKNAYEYYKLFHAVNREIYNEKSSNKIAEMEAKYEKEKNEQKIKTLEKEKKLMEKDKKIQQLTLSRSRTVRNAFVISFTLALVILILLFRKYLYLFSFWKKRVYVGQFIIQEKIGTGGMGTVFRAHSVKNKTTTAAIKILKEELFDSKESRKRFEHEATIIDELNHDHIVKIKERGQYQDKIYIAMELLHGITLNSKLKHDGKLDLGVSVHIMKQISNTLVYIHSRGVIHRDLKPSNIMLIDKNGDPNYVKLLDFGIAKSEEMTKLTQKGELMGTPQYMAPEQFNGADYSTTASDIYSLGVIFYEILTVRSVFAGDVDEVVDKIQNAIPVPPKNYRDEIPLKLNVLILKMLEKDPINRPTIEVVCNTLKEIK